MWFRNLQIYLLSTPFELTAEALHEKLLGRPSRKCGTLEVSTHGWEPPLGRHGKLLVHAVSHCTMICMRHEQKILPAAVVNQQLTQRIADLEEAGGVRSGAVKEGRSRMRFCSICCQRHSPKPF